MQRKIINSVWCSIPFKNLQIRKYSFFVIPCQPSYCMLHHVKCNSLYINKYNFSNNIFNNRHVYIPVCIALQKRHLQLASNSCSKEASKVEETVKVLKEEVKKSKDVANKAAEASSSITPISAPSSAPTKAPVPAKAPAKRSIGKRILDELIHYYHGFRLLFIDIRISSRLIWKILHGDELTRRENKQLVRTVSDLFRLVPFSIFIIIPFMELLLPLFLKLFPQMLPSTFQTTSDTEKKFKTQLKLKIEMAKFLQDTLNEMALKNVKGETHSNTAKEFATFFEKIRTSGEQADNDEILKFSKLFEDEITLDSLFRPSLIALCRLLELQPIGTNNFLRFQLRMKLRNLKADDQMIQKEGIENLTVQELQAACRARGMRALGMPESRLRSQLQQWLDLSLNEKIPPSLLLLSRALYLPENLPAPDQLKATLSSLPDTAATEAKYKIGEIEGKVDNKTKLELIKIEEAAIKKEAEEMVQEKLDQEQKKAEAGETKDILVDKAPILTDKAPTVDTEAEASEKEKLSKEDFDDLEDALENISSEKKKLIIEKEEIEDLKEEMAEYKQDIEELKDIVLETGHKELSESKAALRLSNKVNKMISKMDNLLDGLSIEKENLQQKIDVKAKEGESVKEEKDNIIGINELVLAIRRIQKVSDDTRLQRITDVLEKMDVDHDGAVEVDHVLKVIELLGKDNVKVSTKQMDEIIELLMKEDSLELEEKLQKQKEMQEENVPKDKTGERQA